MPGHFALLVIYALLVSAFFTTLWRRERPAQIKLFLQLFGGLVLGALLVAWLMFPFPPGPPTASP